MRLATHIKTGRYFWPSSHLWVPYGGRDDLRGGQNYPHIFIHPPGSSGRRLGFGIAIKDDRLTAGALDWTSDCRVCITATRPSGRPALIAVQISYESAACGTAALGCVVRLLGRSGVDRLWLPYKAALPEAANKCQAVCERRVCSCVGGKGAHVDRKAGAHTDVQMKMCS